MRIQVRVAHASAGRCPQGHDVPLPPPEDGCPECRAEREDRQQRLARKKRKQRREGHSRAG